MADHRVSRAKDEVYGEYWVEQLKIEPKRKVVKADAKQLKKDIEQFQKMLCQPLLRQCDEFRKTLNKLNHLFLHWDKEKVEEDNGRGHPALEHYNDIRELLDEVNDLLSMLEKVLTGTAAGQKPILVVTQWRVDRVP